MSGNGTGSEECFSKRPRKISSFFFSSLFVCFLLLKVYFSLLLMASVTQVASVPVGNYVA